MTAEKPSQVSYSYAQQPAASNAAGSVSYPTMPPTSSQQPQPPPPPPPQQAFAVGTPAYPQNPYGQQQPPPQYSGQIGCCSDACLSYPQVWLFAFGWIFPILWIVAAFLPLCFPLQGTGERGWWIANMIMAIVGFTLALVVAITVPTLSVVRDGGGTSSTTYYYRG